MISTHVMDAGRGIPAFRMPIQLDVLVSGQGWREVGRGLTNADGQVFDFGETESVGIYRLMFDVASYAAEAFFPSIAVTFEVKDPTERFHIPLLVSPFGYSTHREP